MIMVGSTLFLTAMLAVAAEPPATPVAFEFKDAATYQDRSVLQYRAIEFRDSPVRPLDDERRFGAGPRYGVVPVGPKPDTALTIVWCPKASGGPELWLDANGDGKMTSDERLLSGEGQDVHRAYQS
jgi:hypothetical protein